MKFLIWFGCIVFATALNVLIGYATGYMLGSVLIYLIIVFVARALCRKWDEHKEAKYEAEEEKYRAEQDKYFIKL